MRYGSNRARNENISGNNVRFQVITAARMKMTVFWDVTPCSLVEACRCVTGAYCLHHQGDDDGDGKHI
jgi:hypothetical protein